LGNSGGVSLDELQALFESASDYFEKGKPAAARDLLVQLLEHLPDHPQILTYLGTTSYQIGDREGALAYLERAVTIQPDHNEARRNLAELYFELGEMDRSTAAFTTLCGLMPEDPQAHARLGDVLQTQNRCAEAIMAYERSLTRDPHSADVWAKMSRVLLWEGNWGAALDATDRAIALRPGHTGALALRSVALAELGREREWAELVDFDRLIGAFPIAAPLSYEDMAAFNRALAKSYIENPSLVFDPSDYSTKGGYHSASLHQRQVMGAVGDLIDAIEACVVTYVKERPQAAGHPFLGQRPEAWEIVIWGIVLPQGGYQDPHIHRDAWLSGVYYPQVPTILQDAENDRAGWIEFGQAQPYPKATAPSVVRQYPPVEGSLYLFPSYFYHRTIPFEADVQRVSIAFDMIPASPA